MKNLGALLIVCFLLIITHHADAQNSIQYYTPSLLFDKGNFEFKTYQNLYSQTKQFKSNLISKEPTNRGRESYFTSINQFLYGVSGQINAGLEIWIKNVTLENGSNKNRTAISGIGPKIKIAPFKKIKRLSIQSSLLLPVSKDLEGRDPGAEKPFLFVDTDRSLWLTQFFYDWKVSSNWQLFFQQAFWQNFTRDSFRQNNFLQSQSSVFVSFFPNNRWTVFGMTEYFPTHYDDTNQEFSLSYSYFVQSGIGIKYQLIPNLLEAEAQYTNFWLGSQGNGAGATYNLGFRLVRQ